MFVLHKPNRFIQILLYVYLIAMAALIAYLFYFRFSPATEIYRISPLPPTQSQVGPAETSCVYDSDCIVNNCGCHSLNRNYLEEKEFTCLMYCDVHPVCINNQCVSVPNQIE